MLQDSCSVAIARNVRQQEELPASTDIHWNLSRSGQISEQGLLEDVHINVAVGADGLEGSLLHLGVLPSDGRGEGVTFAQIC